MAKAKRKSVSLLEKVKAAPIRKAGNMAFIDKLSAEQQVEYKALLKYMKAGRRGVDRPTIKDVCKLIRESFGVPISHSTFRDQLRDV